MKAAKAIGIQYAALPFRTVGRRVEIMLMTSRQTRRWVIPKGWPMRGMKPQDAAATEAVEEAGIIGEVEPKPIGSYRYLKRLKSDQETAVQVIVFPFLVRDRIENWKEKGQRDYMWVRYQRAASLVAEVSLSRLIREFGKARTPGMFRLSAADPDRQPFRWGGALFPAARLIRRPAQREQPGWAARGAIYRLLSYGP